MDEIIRLFDEYRKQQSEISRLAEELLQCAPRETAQYSADAIRVAQEVPELQLLIEREESFREQIQEKCQAAGIRIDQINDLFSLLTDSRQKYIIRRYYLEGATMTNIASALPYCVKQCRRIRSDAFRTMAEKMSLHVPV
jgi:DNA-directed RNA polymerase specialized sigma24 family protein